MIIATGKRKKINVEVKTVGDQLEVWRDGKVIRRTKVKSSIIHEVKNKKGEGVGLIVEQHLHLLADPIWWYHTAEKEGWCQAPLTAVAQMPILKKERKALLKELLH